MIIKSESEKITEELENVFSIKKIIDNVQEKPKAIKINKIIKEIQMVVNY
jgi:hypothetical protein